MSLQPTTNVLLNTQKQKRKKLKHSITENHQSTKEDNKKERIKELQNARNN